MDPNQHPEIEAWARKYSGDLDYLDFVSRRLSLPDWVSVARIFRPKFIEVSGCVVWDRSYEPDNFQEWFDSLKGDVTAVESVLNKLRLWQFIDIGNGSEADEAAMLGIAHDIAYFWEASLKESFPDMEFEVTVADTEDGPEVGFVVRRQEAD